MPNIERFGYAADFTADTKTRKVSGYAITFNTFSEDRGGYVVSVAPQAVDRTLSSKKDVRALVNHDSAHVIGRFSAGTLSFQKDAKGLLVTVDVPETTYGNDLLVSIARRDITGMSFGTEILNDSLDMKPEVPVRTILDMDFFEVSFVTFPAFQSTTATLASLFAAHQPTGASVAYLRRVHMLKLAR